MQDNPIYRKLQQHLDTLPVGFPRTASGVELKILAEIFSVEDAAIALLLSFIPKKFTELSGKLSGMGLDADAAAKRLEDMYQRGLLGKSTSKHGSAASYRLNMFVIGSYEYQVDRMSREFAANSSRYLDEALDGALTHTGIPQLRTIPIQKSLRPENHLLPYEKGEEMLKEMDGTFAVASCICRQNRDIIDKNCHHTKIRETCLLFGSTADHWIDIGRARAITKEESLALLRNASEAGLVLQPTNTKKPAAICCCCGCCCGLLRAAKKHPRPVELFTTNFQVLIDEDKCTGCRLCLKHCHMEAIAAASGKKCRVEPHRCIGCGTCVPLCKAGALKLANRPQKREAFDDFKQLYIAIFKKRFGIRGLLKVWLKSKLGIG